MSERYRETCEKCQSTDIVRYKFHWLCPKHLKAFKKKEQS